jgi:Na+/H+-dicarboxylate symporter
LSITNPKTSPIVLFFNDVNKVMAKLITLLVSFTGIGVFSLVVPKFATLDLTQLITYIGTFLGCVFTGLAFHAFIVYPAIFFIACRKNPFPYMKNALPAVFTAMGTSSSAATLPVTLACAKVNGVRDSIAKFVISLGCTVNMDGTAIGFPTAVIFMAQAQGIYMNFGEMVVVVFLSAVASMGAAPIPSAGLVLLVMIMESTRVPITEIFGLILAVDWLYDRPETMVNIFGDSLAAVIIEHFTPAHDEEDADMEKGALVEKETPTVTPQEDKKVPEVPV